jgi:hypothetical protein
MDTDMDNNMSNNFYTNEIFLHNILLTTNNYINSYNNSITYLNNANNNIMTLLLNNSHLYNNYLRNNTPNNTHNNTPNNTHNNTPNNTNTNSQNAYLLNYTLEDYENLSNVNIKALVQICTAKINYCCIAIPINDTCPITQEEFSTNEEVTIIKNCGHIFKNQAIKNWLTQHQTCPICRYNILTNSSIISYINPDNNKKLFLYSNEFRFYLALHIESLLVNRDGSENEESDSINNTNSNNRTEQNTYEFGLFLR